MGEGKFLSFKFTLFGKLLYLLEGLKFGSIEEMNLRIFSSLEFAELVKSLLLRFVTILNSFEKLSSLTPGESSWK